MQLFYSALSPFVRKVMACAVARGIDGQIATVPCNAWNAPPELLAANPLSRIPCLVTDDGVALFDSPVICEFLDSVGDAIAMFPPHGAARWRALKQQALGDGVLDAAVGRRLEMTKPREAARDAWMERQKAAIERALDALEGDVLHGTPDIGVITIACALGYLDFRFAAEPWRPSRPRLGEWYEQISAQRAIAATAPRE